MPWGRRAPHRAITSGWRNDTATWRNCATTPRRPPTWSRVTDSDSSREPAGSPTYRLTTYRRPARASAAPASSATASSTKQNIARRCAVDIASRAAAARTVTVRPPPMAVASSRWVTSAVRPTASSWRVAELTSTVLGGAGRSCWPGTASISASSRYAGCPSWSPHSTENRTRRTGAGNAAPRSSSTRSSRATARISAAFTSVTRQPRCSNVSTSGRRSFPRSGMRLHVLRRAMPFEVWHALPLGAEGGRNLAGGTDDHRAEAGHLGPGHVEAEPGDADRADGLAAAVHHHGAHAAHPRDVLLVVERPAPGPDGNQVGQQGIRRGDRARHALGQPGAGRDEAYLVVGQRGQDRLADGRAVQRQRGADAGAHAVRAPAVEPVDVNRLVALAYPEMDRIAAALAQRP